MERRLGRGLGSLLGQSQDDAEVKVGTDGDGEVLEERGQGIGELVEVAAIRRNPDQPRKAFDSDALEELRSSIKQHGVLQPITLRRMAGGFQIIAGERRWRAARSAGLERIPAIIKDEVDDALTLELAIVENVQRQDLDPLEKARGYRALMERVGLKQDEVAARVGVSRSAVANQLRLLDLPEKAQEALAGGLITAGHARALLGIKGEAAQVRALESVVRKDLSVRETEALAKGGGNARAAAGSPTEPSLTPGNPPWVGELEGRIREALGVKVTLRNGRGFKGSITLDYAGRDELERLCDQIAPKDELR